MIFLILKLSSHVLTARSGYSPLHSSWAGGWTFICCNRTQKSHQDPCSATTAAQVGKAYGPQSQLGWGHHTMLFSISEFTGPTCLPGSPPWRASAVLTQEAGHLSRNQKYFSCQFMSCPWPWNVHLTMWKRDGSPWGQTEGHFMFPCWLVVDISFYNWNRGRNKPFLFAFPFSKMNIFITSSATLVLHSLLNVYRLSAPRVMKILLADLAENEPIFIHTCMCYVYIDA